MVERSVIKLVSVFDSFNIRLVNWHLNIVGKVEAMVEGMWVGANTKARV